MRRHGPVLSWACGVALGGCLTEASFHPTARAIACQRWNACAPEQFDLAFRSFPECLERYPLFVETGCEARWCSFDSARAQECVEDLRDAPCPGDAGLLGSPSSLSGACDEVWVACDAPALDACLVQSALDGILGR